MTAEHRPRVIEALAENCVSVARTIRPIFAWFVVSSLVVGVPKMLELSANGVKSGYASLRCAMTSCSADTERHYTDAEIVDMAIKIVEEQNPGKYAEIVVKPKKG